MTKSKKRKSLYAASPPPSYSSITNSNTQARPSKVNYGPHYYQPATRTIRETTPLYSYHCNHTTFYTKRSRSRCADEDCVRACCAIFLFLFFVGAISAVIYGLVNYLNGPSVELPEPHPYWDIPTADNHCHSYGTREYNARLLNISNAYDRMEWCMRTPIVIRDVTIDQPNFCETRYGNVYGHWLVDFEEYRCLPHWGPFKDNGCTVRGSGFRRFSSRLWGISKGESWMKLCATAPTEINHIYFQNPTFCEHKGIFGMYGIWEVPDDRC